MLLEKFWHFGREPFGLPHNRSRVGLSVERERDVGVAVLFRPPEEFGFTSVWVDGKGRQLIKNKKLFGLTIHVLLWRLTLFCIQAKET